MPDELVFFSLLAVIWILVGGIVVRFCANSLFGKQVSMKRASLTQAISIFVVPCWFGWRVYGFHILATLETFRSYSIILTIASIYQFIVIIFTLRLSILQSIVAWFMSALGTLLFFEVVLISFKIDSPGIRAVFTKAQGEMRTIATALTDHANLTGSFPVSVDEQGLPMEPVGELYYRGPSFVPDVLVHEGALSVTYSDVFRKDNGPYGYGAGPISGASAAFLLTSRGPDLESQAEDLEYLYLDKLRGDVERFWDAPECLNLLYSPTNGTVSPGDLCRGHRNPKTR